MRKALGFRRSPWDMDVSRPRRALGSQHDPQSDVSPLVVCRFCLHGRWTVDPKAITPEDARRFMWEGLRVFRKQAKASGIPGSQIDDMIQMMFDPFHDAATDIYHALSMVQVAPPKHGRKWLELHHGSDFWVEPEPECILVSLTDKPILEDCQTVPSIEEASQTELAHKDWFVACEEDRPVPVAVRYRKPEPLLDPDRDLLESFES